MAKILIVEDEVSVAEAIKEKLKNAGIDAQCEFDGKTGIEALQRENYDLVILDLIMPVMDGFQFLEELKNLGIKVPVIVTSNLSSEDDVARAKELGAKDYFVKVETPIEELLEIIKRALKNGEEE